jgi:hypothetical protein
VASKPDPNRPRIYCLPRLPREYYQGDAVVHWTLTVFDRAKGWLSEAFHGRFRELMLHAAAREGLFCPAYVLMPDCYVLHNPVRAGLVERPEAWKFSGAVVPGYPALHPLEPGYWPLFWKLLANARQPDSGNIVRPPFNLGASPHEL